MRKLSRFHVAVASLAVLSVVSLLGTSLVVTQASPANWVDLFGVKAVEATPFYKVSPSFVLIWPWIIDRTSPLYSSWGRSQIHVLAVAEGLGAGQEIEIRIWGRIYKPDLSEYKNVLAYTYTIYDTYPTVDFRTDIPAHKFYFQTSGPTTSNISLSFMLSFGS